MIVHPTARAGATFLVIIAKGKFQGVIAATTPIGCLITISLWSFVWDGITSPYALLPSSANHLTKEAPYATSPLLSFIGLPDSKVIISARLSVYSNIRSFHFSSILDLSLAVYLLQLLDALLADLIAFLVILIPPSKTEAIVFPLAGLVTSKVFFPSLAQFPST